MPYKTAQEMIDPQSVDSVRGMRIRNRPDTDPVAHWPGHVNSTISDLERDLFDSFGEHLKVAGNQEQDAKVAGKDEERESSYFNF